MKCPCLWVAQSGMSALGRVRRAPPQRSGPLLNAGAQVWRVSMCEGSPERVVRDQTGWEGCSHMGQGSAVAVGVGYGGHR